MKWSEVMLTKALIMEILSVALENGGDFSEVFIEDAINNTLNMTNGTLETAVTGRDYGIGIRIFKGLESVYGYTSQNDRESLLEVARKLSKALGTNDKKNRDIILREFIPTNIHKIIEVPSLTKNIRKYNIMNLADKAARSFGSEIVQTSIYYLDVDQRVCIANSHGLYTQDRRIRTRLGISSVASDGIENQTGLEAPGRRMGIEMFETVDPEYFALEASRVASLLLKAKPCPGGKMMVSIDNGFGGVIFHEACGHALEATAVAKGNSVFANKLGERIASDKVTAIDDGTMANEWGSLNIDDEGIPTTRKVLIENGVLKGYMIDSLNGRRMAMAPTGSSRRESYRYAPTSRMTNTYIDKGEDEEKAIISSMPYGLYAKKMGGGSVNPITGEFNFAVREGYIVRNGNIEEPVRGATLIGLGSEILKNIDMVGKKMEMGQGMCGSISGSIPTNVGQPMLRVSEITVGGR